MSDYWDNWKECGNCYHRTDTGFCPKHQMWVRDRWLCRDWRALEGVENV